MSSPALLPSSAPRKSEEASRCPTEEEEGEEENQEKEEKTEEKQEEEEKINDSQRWESHESTGFDGTLLRSVSLRFVLSRFGNVLVTRSGSEKTFYMSKPSDKISIFLSHSWSTPGHRKIVGLMYFANLRRAFFISAMVAVALFFWIATSGDWLLNPGSLYFAGRDEIREIPTIVLGVVPTLLFLILLIFGQHLPMGHTPCFLDKCCIHQTDAVKKREGIKLLSRFLRISDKLMILWDPDYMTRLWCVYELAAFRHFKGNVDGSIHFLPLRVPSALIALYIAHALAAVMVQTAGPLLLSEQSAEWVQLRTPPDFIALHYFMIAFISFLLAFLPCTRLVYSSFKSHLLDHQTLVRQLHEFSLSQTACCLPEDREFVEGQIKQWFGSVQQFEQEVRTNVADCVAKQIQTQVPMKWAPIALTALPDVFIIMMHVAHFIRQREWNLVMVASFYMATFACCSSTIPIAIMFRWRHLVEDSTPKHKKVLYVVLIHFSFAFCSAFALVLISPASAGWLMVVVIFLMVGVTIVMYWFPIRQSPVQTDIFQNPPIQEGFCKEVAPAPSSYIDIVSLDSPGLIADLQKHYEDDELSWN